MDLSQLTLEQLNKKERDLKILELHRLQNESHRYYVPIGKAQKFIEYIGSGNYLTILLEAANGVGKTLAASNILANLFWTVDNPCFNYPLFKHWPYAKKGRIVSDPNTVIETIIPTLKEVFPKGRYKTDQHYETTKDGRHYESSWKTDTGWSFKIMTYEQDVKEFESANLGFVWEDEPPPKLIHTANIARLRMGGVCFMTETPLSGSQWLFDDFIDVPPEKRIEQKKAIVQAELEDACTEHGDRGFLEHSQVQLMVAQYDDDEKMARAFGKHAHLSGLIFKKWNEKVHVIKPFYLTDQDWVVAHALDPHPRVNDAGLWVAFGRDDRIVVCDELWGGFDTEELAIRVKGINKSYRILKRLIDPSAYIVDKHTGRSLAGDLHNQGLMYNPGSKERTTAIRLIRDVINYQYQNGQFIVPPKLYVFDTCPRFIWEMGHWQWEDWRGKTAQYKSLKEKPIDKDEHMIECLGRALLSGIKYEPIAHEREYSSKSPILDPYSGNSTV